MAAKLTAAAGMRKSMIDAYRSAPETEAQQAAASTTGGALPSQEEMLKQVAAALKARAGQADMQVPLQDSSEAGQYASELWKLAAATGACLRMIDGFRPAVAAWGGG